MPVVRFIAIMCVLSIAQLAASTQNTNPPNGAERKKDIYSVYSHMIANPPDKAVASDPIYIIAASTTRDRPFPDLQGCFRVPSADEPSWREILIEFANTPNSPGTLDREINNLSKPYVLLNADQVTPFQVRRGRSSSIPEYQGAHNLIQLSDVYFNQGRTVAVAGFQIVSKRATWQVFRKNPAGQWIEEERWAGCAGAF